MKIHHRLALLGALLLVPVHAEAGGMLKELTNAAKLGTGDGPEDDYVSFTMHLGGGTEPVVVTGRDYQSFAIFEDAGTPKTLELYHGKGEEKHNILINISAARYYQLKIVKRYDQWHYDFHFYY